MQPHRRMSGQMIKGKTSSIPSDGIRGIRRSGQRLEGYSWCLLLPLRQTLSRGGSKFTVEGEKRETAQERGKAIHFF